MDASHPDCSFHGKRKNTDRRLRTVLIFLFLVTVVLIAYGIEFKQTTLIEDVSAFMNKLLNLLKIGKKSKLMIALFGLFVTYVTRAKFTNFKFWYNVLRFKDFFF